jgi:collagen type VI alpha
MLHQLFFPVCAAKADLVFVLDSSGSIRDNNPPDGSYDNWNLILSFINNLIDKLIISEDATRIGLVSYSEKATNNFFLRDYYDKQELQQAVSSVAYIGSFTNTSGGLWLMKDQQFTAERGDRSDVMNIAIVITDGVSNIDKRLTIPHAEAARNKGIIIFIVGITGEIDEQELEGVSSMPHMLNKQYFKSSDFNKLRNIVDTLLMQVCNELGPQPQPPPSSMSTTTTKRAATGMLLNGVTVCFITLNNKHGCTS